MAKRVVRGWVCNKNATEAASELASDLSACKGKCACQWLGFAEADYMKMCRKVKITITVEEDKR